MNEQLLNEQKIVQQNQVLYRTSLVMIISSMIGVGYLTLPSVLKGTGLVNGLILIIISSLASLLGSFQLQRALNLYPSDSYPHLVEQICGMKMKNLLTIDLFFYLMFSNTMYIYFSCHLFTLILDKYDLEFLNYPKFIALIFSIFGFLMNLVKLTQIRWAGYLSNFFSLMGALVLIIQMNSYYLYYREERIKKIELFIFGDEILPALGACFFSFTNHFSIVPIMKELQNSPKHTQYSTILRSQYLPLFLYLTVAFAGYVSLGENAPDFILFREPLEGSNDILMSIVQLGTVFVLILGITMRIFSMTNNFVQLIQDKNKNENKKMKILLMLVITFTCYVFSIFIHRLISIISLCSSILCPFFVIICPSILSIKLKKQLKIGTLELMLIYLYMFIFSGGLLGSIIDQDVIG